MNAEEFTQMAAKVGLTASGGYESANNYGRAFLVCPQGITLGRAVFYQGEFSHIKWYLRGTGPLDQTDYYKVAWSLLLQKSQILSRGQWSSALEEAHELKKRDYQERLAKRKALGTVSAGGKKVKRKALADRNIRPFILQSLGLKGFIL